MATVDRPVHERVPALIAAGEPAVRERHPPGLAVLFATETGGVSLLLFLPLKPLGRAMPGV
jgi:hypothetical protein